MTRTMAALALLSVYLAQPASAQDVGSPGWGNLSARWGSATSLTYHYSADAQDRAPSPGLRLHGAFTYERLLIAGFVETSTASASGQSYQSTEAWGLLAARVVGDAGLGFTWGHQRPIFGAEGDVIQTIGGGVFLGRAYQWDGGDKPWVYLGAVARRAADPARPLVGEPPLRLAIGLQVPIRDRTSALVKALPGWKWQVDVGVSVRIR